MPARWGELRTWAAAVDPGHTRLHLASVATAAMLLAAVAASVLRALTGQPITIVLFSVVLAMISNLAVNENDLRRRRVTTALMICPPRRRRRCPRCWRRTGSRPTSCSSWS